MLEAKFAAYFVSSLRLPTTPVRPKPSPVLKNRWVVVLTPEPRDYPTTLVKEILGEMGRELVVKRESLPETLVSFTDTHVIVNDVFDDSESVIVRCGKTCHSMLRLVEEWYRHEAVGFVVVTPGQENIVRERFPKAEVHIIPELSRQALLAVILKFKGAIILGSTLLSPISSGLPIRDPLRVILEQVSEQLKFLGNAQKELERRKKPLPPKMQTEQFLQADVPDDTDVDAFVKKYEQVYDNFKWDDDAAMSDAFKHIRSPVQELVTTDDVHGTTPTKTRKLLTKRMEKVYWLGDDATVAFMEKIQGVYKFHSLTSEIQAQRYLYYYHVALFGYVFGNLDKETLAKKTTIERLHVQISARSKRKSIECMGQMLY